MPLWLDTYFSCWTRFASPFCLFCSFAICWHAVAGVDYMCCCLICLLDWFLLFLHDSTPRPPPAGDRASSSHKCRFTLSCDFDFPDPVLIMEVGDHLTSMGSCSPCCRSSYSPIMINGVYSGTYCKRIRLQFQIQRITSSICGTLLQDVVISALWPLPLTPGLECDLICPPLALVFSHTWHRGVYDVMRNLLWTLTIGHWQLTIGHLSFSFPLNWTRLPRHPQSWSWPENVSENRVDWLYHELSPVNMFQAQARLRIVNGQ